MRLQPENRLPQQYDAASLARLLRDFAQQLNSLSEGYVQATTNAVPTIPTTGTYTNGDFVKKVPIVQAGAGGSKYVILGWLRLTSGSSHVLNTDWLEVRVLTGN